ncbi:MAG: hypothetical protein A2091_07465 [Desulfuromonadales bacterium GWD2_61_12]|nr:MAG: hypothetical protein A2005_07170 [Desulfuromonadales bacterium GWC2_61_20]OGR32761.1 MAG: hypothetical protein A2091_07465 [Desulfuromonadales bacterium GWD2_61_12]
MTTGLYLHIPFCRSKCAYCDFFSLPVPGAAELQRYGELLLRQLRQEASSWGGPVATIFFGGGTPSLLPPATVGEILETVAATMGIAGDAEITLEANPGTVDAAALTELRQAGINRLSLGLQSLDDRQLLALGRGHDVAAGLAAVAAARRAGFANLSLDLIYALPGQQVAALERELQALVALAPEHISTYALTVEEGTVFYSRVTTGAILLPDEEETARHYRAVDGLLTAAGYAHYEISNFARPARACRHNLDTWRRRPYLGLGAGAHSFRAEGWGERRAAPPDLDLYARRVASGESASDRLESFDRRGAMSEVLYLGLRTAEGVSESDFCQRFGLGVAAAFPAALQRCGPRLRCVGDRWTFDLQGWLLYDHLISFFL